MRPNKFQDFVGQEDICRQINVALDAALARGDVIDHVLLAGPPGLGKTTISRIIANTLKTKCVETIASVIKKPSDIITSLVHLKRGDVLFIDEIHALPLAVQEYLYTAMEDYKINTIFGREGTRRTIAIELQKFVLVGATTMEGLISSPMLDRFGIICRLQPYKATDIMEIVRHVAAKEKWQIDENSLIMIANRARSTPRVALRQYRRIKDMCRENVITPLACKNAYDMLGIAQYGLTQDDRKVLNVLEPERPVGLDALAAMTNISRYTLESVIEPHLLRFGFIVRRPRGRMITEKGAAVAAKYK